MVDHKLKQNLSRRLLIGRWINIEARVPDGAPRQRWQGQITISPERLLKRLRMKRACRAFWSYPIVKSLRRESVKCTPTLRRLH